MTEFGRLDVRVQQRRARRARSAAAHETEVEDWDFTFAVLVRGVFLGIKHGARAMKATGLGGSIINTASVAGLSGGAGPAAYSAAKAAVINLTRAAALELRRAPHPRERDLPGRHPHAAAPPREPRRW